MTPEQIQIASDLNGATFPPGSADKRFVRQMAWTAEHNPTKSLTPAQDQYLRNLAFKYRRQIPLSTSIGADPSKSLSVLQWMAPALVKNGFITNEPWISENCTEAAGMYREKNLQIAAVLFAAMHPHAIDYLRQAPVIACGLASQWRLNDAKGRNDAASTVKSMLQHGPKLRVVMDYLGLAYPLRRIGSPHISTVLTTTFQTMLHVHPSELSQAIPTDPIQMDLWLEACRRWFIKDRVRAPHSLFYRETRPYIRWGVIAIGRAIRDGDFPGPFYAEDVADFAIASHLTFNWNWTWGQALRASGEWHLQFHSGVAAELPGSDIVVDYGPLPVKAEIDGFEIVALRSRSDFLLEGRRMHHCVSTYFTEVQGGYSRIYSIRKNDVPVATGELRRIDGGLSWKAGFGENVDWSIHQIKGPCNAIPLREAKAAFEIFLTQVNQQEQAEAA